MSSTDRLLYCNEREHLVTGYIRKSSNLYVPKGIKMLCAKYYDDVHYWEIKGNQYTEFMSCVFRESLNGPIFTIKNIQFQLFSFPKGEYFGEQGYIQLYLKVLQYPAKLRSLHLYFVLYCEQTGNEFRRAKIFTFSDTETENETNEYVHAWAAHCAPVKECESFKMITFGAMVDILHIEYYDEAAHKSYITPIQMNTKCEYIWNINKEMIEKLKSLDFEQFICSDRFDDGCWGMCMMPNGKQRDDRGNVALGLVLYQLPFGVSIIKVKYTLNCIETNTVWCDEKDYVINIKWTSWPNGVFLTKQLDDHETLTFSVSLEITHVFGAEYAAIHRKDWDTFGIIAL